MNPSKWPARRLLLGTALCVAASLTEPPTVNACTFSPVSADAASERVPLQGPVFIDVRCTQTDYCETGTPELMVTLDGTAIDGDVHVVREAAALFVVWTPDAPLTAGRTYHFALSGHESLTGSGPLEVTADSEMQWAVPAIEAWASTLDAAWHPTGERFCCPNLISCFGTCFSASEVRSATIQVISELESQLPVLLRMRWQPAGESERTTGWRRGEFSPVVARFDQSADRFCATLEVRDLIDGTVTARELCHEADPNEAYGMQRQPIFEPDAFQWGDCVLPPTADRSCDPSTEQCTSPPEALLDAWCAHGRDRCPNADTSGIGAEHCEAVASHCTARTPDAGTDAQPDAAMPERESTARPDAGMPEQSETTASTRTASGCNVSHTDATGSVWVLAWIALFWPRLRRLAVARDSALGQNPETAREPRYRLRRAKR